MRESKDSLYPDDRVWYDQFTSTDWVHDSIADAYRVKALRSRTDIRGRIKAFFDGTQGWILSALVGFLTAVVAYTVDVSEAPVFDWKDGYCQEGFFLSEKVRVNLLFFDLTRRALAFEDMSPRCFRALNSILCWFGESIHRQPNHSQLVQSSHVDQRMFFFSSLLHNIPKLKHELTQILAMLSFGRSLRILEILVKFHSDSSRQRATG
jgi:hypothetical protein